MFRSYRWVMWACLCLSGAWGFHPQEIREAYRSGEFEMVRDSLEPALRSGRLKVEDEIFALKMLGVIEAADPAREPKARQLFYRLLDLAPTVEIHDLYPSERIKALFKQVKFERERESAYTSRYDAIGRPKQEQASTPENLRKERQAESTKPKTTQIEPQAKRTWLPWVLIGSAAAVGVGIYVLTIQDDKSNSSNKNDSSNVVDPFAK